VSHDTDVHSDPIERSNRVFAGIWWLMVLRGVCGILFGRSRSWPGRHDLS